jgi:hypothetical protein
MSNDPRFMQPCHEPRVARNAIGLPVALTALARSQLVVWIDRRGSRGTPLWHVDNLRSLFNDVQIRRHHGHRPDAGWVVGDRPSAAAMI